MEAQYKKFIVGFIILVSVSLFTIMFINYKIDCYGIFTADYTKVGQETNNNYIKTKYIIENPEKFDSFIFGSSRVEYIPVENLEGGKFYNMTYVQGIPSEWLDTIKTFKKNNVSMKNIIIAVDDFSATIFPEEHLNSPNLLSYSSIKNNLSNIIKYYLLKNPLDDRSKAIIKNGRPSNVNVEGTGRVIRIDDEEFYRSDAHLNKSMFERPTILGNYENNRIDEVVNEIKQIKDLCDNNNISLTVIFNPIHITTYENTNKEKLLEFKSKLSEITNYWDFNSINEITTNNYYWYETSHYREIVGSMMLKKIYGEQYKKDIEVPSEFGKLVIKKIL